MEEKTIWPKIGLETKGKSLQPYKWNLLLKSLVFFEGRNEWMNGWFPGSLNKHMLWTHPNTWGETALAEWSGDDAKMLTTLSDPQVVQVSSVEDGWNVSWQRLLDVFWKYKQLCFVMFVVKVLIEGRAKTCFCHSCGLFFVCVCHTLSCRIVSKSIFMIKIGFHVDLGDVSQHFSRIPKMLHLSRQAQVMDFRKF